MLTTNKYHLKKPEGTDQVDIQDFNDNADIIDEELGKRPEKTGDASNMTNTFTRASSRTQLVSGESLKTSLGKIMKWFADLKTVAFTGKYTDLSEKPVIPSGTAAACGVVNNLTTTVAGYVLDARQGKALKDEINTLNGSLGRTIAGVRINNVNIPPNTIVNICKITLPAGIWLLFLEAWIPPSVGGFSMSVDGAGIHTDNNSVGQASLCGFAVLTSATTLYVKFTHWEAVACNSDDFGFISLTGISIK